MVRKAKKKLMDEKIYLIDLMNLSNHLHILNYGEFDIIKIGIINTSRNFQMFPSVFCLKTVKNIGKIYPYQRILAKYQGKRD